MSDIQPKITVNVDVTNPGQYFACCGLFELAHRLWPGSEAWFEAGSGITRFFISQPNIPASGLEMLVEVLRTCVLEGLDEQEKQDRNRLDGLAKNLKKQNQKLSKKDKERLDTLGKMSREGALHLQVPFWLRLDWWQAGEDKDDAPSVKTWAGRQEIHKVARSMQEALSQVADFENLFAYSCILQTPLEYRKEKGAKSKGIASFCFDARKFAHNLDVGFSLDVQQIKSPSYPAVELLSLIGLQRFHPPSEKKWHFNYTPWLYPLAAPVAAAVACGMTSGSKSCEHEFRLLFRDDQRRYKAFSYSHSIGD